MKKIVSVIIAFLVCFETFGQGIDQNFYPKMPAIAAPSPNVASIEKFGNIPVDHSTGATSINVPIWQIKCGELSWPISLSYHSGGIKVDEISSTVGLGWALGGEAMISRSVAGKPDEASAGEPSYANITSNDWYFLYGVRDGLQDAELDIYNYTFNGRSGKFLIKQNGGIFQMPYTSMKITQTVNGFVIVDEAGMIYTFNKKESLTAIGPSETNIYTSAWRLTKAETPDKKQAIDFLYTDAGNSQQTSYSFTQSLGSKYITQGECNLPILQPINDAFPIQSATVNIVDCAQLSQINFPNGSISLTYTNDRTDATGTAKGRLTTISIIKQPLNQIVRKYQLSQSYFSTGSRLRLDNVKALNYVDVPIEVYGFEYNNLTMAPVGSFAQDKWGFNNGKTTNGGLLQTESVIFNGTGYTIGNANRSVDTVAMKAGMLTAVNWPTGGRSEFIYDAHQYYTGSTATTPTTISANVQGNMPSHTATTNFTFPGSAMQPRVLVDISRFNFAGGTGQPYVQLRDLTAGYNVYYRINTDAGTSLHTEQAISLQAGHNYAAEAFIFSSVQEPQLTAQIRVTWNNYTGVAEVEKGGGLRVRSIKNYAKTGVLATTEYYEYDIATTLTPYHFIKQRYNDVRYRHGEIDCFNTACIYYPSDICRNYNSGSVYAASRIGGAPLMYNTVTKYELNLASAPNGKTVYEYDVIQDQGIGIGSFSNVAQILVNDWKNGFLKSESYYRVSGSTYELVKKVENHYSEIKADETYNLNVRNNFIVSGCALIYSASTVSTDLGFGAVPIKTGVKKLARTIETTYDNLGNNIQKIVDNQYNGVSHDLLTKTSTFDSKGTTISSTLKYPVDFTAAGNVFSKMITANIVSPVIERKRFAETGGSSVLLATVKNGYRDWKNDGLVLMPDTIKASTYSNPLIDKIIFTDYTDRRNPSAVNKALDLTKSYLYDHNFQYPIAEITNAGLASVAYTGFEGDSKGGWTFSGTPIEESLAPTGRNCYVLGSSISRTGLSATTTYIVSYWLKSGTVTVNSAAAGTAIKTANGWSYYEHTVVNPPSGTITVAGTSGKIDELRLYPASKVEMTTFSFDPLVGVTAQCDINNTITYYEYDELQRLMLIRDEDRYITKKIAYNYAGQPEYQNIYYNTVQSGVFQKQGGCSACLVGSNVTYTVPANKYSSTKDQLAANQLALNEVAANGQANANALGTCVAPASVPVLYTTSVNTLITLKFHNNCTGVDQTYPLNGNFTNFSIPNIAAGNYNITMTVSSGGNYSFTVNGYTEYEASPGLITNVNLAAGGNTITIHP